MNLTVKSAFPTEVTYKLFRSVSNISTASSSDPTSRLQLINSTAYLDSAQLSDSGRYVLQASNSEGSAQVHFEIQVQCKLIKQVNHR
jgi:hypothetical protein